MQKKTIFLAVFLLIASPAIGRLIREPSAVLGRHIQYLQGGERGRRFSSINDIGQTYFNNTRKVIGQFIPDRDRKVCSSFSEVVLENSTFVLFALGLAGIFFVVRRSQRLVLCGIFLIVSGILILSNPQYSMYRVIALAPFCFIFAGIGAGLIFRLLRAGGLQNERFLVLILSVAHLLCFVWYYKGYIDCQFNEEKLQGDEHSVHLLVEGLQGCLRSDYLILVPSDSIKIAVRTLVVGRVGIKSYNDSTGLAQIINEREAPTIVTVFPGGSVFDVKSEVNNLLQSIDSGYLEIPIMDKFGKERVRLFVKDALAQTHAVQECIMRNSLHRRYGALHK